MWHLFHEFHCFTYRIFLVGSGLNFLRKSGRVLFRNRRVSLGSFEICFLGSDWVQSLLNLLISNDFHSRWKFAVNFLKGKNLLLSYKVHSRLSLNGYLTVAAVQEVLIRFFKTNRVDSSVTSQVRNFHSPSNAKFFKFNYDFLRDCGKLWPDQIIPFECGNRWYLFSAFKDHQFNSYFEIPLHTGIHRQGDRETCAFHLTKFSSIFLNFWNCY